MKTQKLKGFTLVELIVVIAIIGVLAAILVPTMLGYVKKAKMSGMNSSAKSLHDAVAAALVEVDDEGENVVDNGDYTRGDLDYMDELIVAYYNGYEKANHHFYYRVDGMAVIGATVNDMNYIGGFPTPSNNTNGKKKDDGTFDYGLDEASTIATSTT